MNKLVWLTLFLGLCVTSWGEPARSMTITNASTLISPDRSRQFYMVGSPNPTNSVGPWTTGSVVIAGSYYQVGSTNFYVALDSGTTGTNVFTHTRGEASDGTITWLAIPLGANGFALKRRGVSITLISGSAVYLNTFHAAVTNKGVALLSVGSSWSPDYMTQKEIFAMSASNSVIAIQERLQDED